MRSTPRPRSRTVAIRNRILRVLPILMLAGMVLPAFLSSHEFLSASSSEPPVSITSVQSNFVAIELQRITRTTTVVTYASTQVAVLVYMDVPGLSEDWKFQISLNGNVKYAEASGGPILLVEPPFQQPIRVAGIRMVPGDVLAIDQSWSPAGTGVTTLPRIGIEVNGTQTYYAPIVHVFVWSLVFHGLIAAFVIGLIIERPSSVRFGKAGLVIIGAWIFFQVVPLLPASPELLAGARITVTQALADLGGSYVFYHGVFLFLAVQIRQRQKGASELAKLMSRIISVVLVVVAWNLLPAMLYRVNQQLGVWQLYQPALSTILMVFIGLSAAYCVYLVHDIAAAWKEHPAPFMRPHNHHPGRQFVLAFGHFFLFLLASVLAISLTALTFLPSFGYDVPTTITLVNAFAPEIFVVSLLGLLAVRMIAHLGLDGVLSMVENTTIAYICLTIAAIGLGALAAALSLVLPNSALQASRPWVYDLGTITSNSLEFAFIGSALELLVFDILLKRLIKRTRKRILAVQTIRQKSRIHSQVAL